MVLENPAPPVILHSCSTRGAGREGSTAAGGWVGGGMEAASCSATPGRPPGARVQPGRSMWQCGGVQLTQGAAGLAAAAHPANQLGLVPLARPPIETASKQSPIFPSAQPEHRNPAPTLPVQLAADLYLWVQLPGVLLITILAGSQMTCQGWERGRGGVFGVRWELGGLQAVMRWRDGGV